VFHGGHLRGARALSLPWLFVAGLALTTFGLTLLGALGERYASIAQATVTLAIYTMIGIDQHAASGSAVPAWHGAVHLLVGAAWYGLLSILWTARSPTGRCASGWRDCSANWGATCTQGQPVRAGAQGRPAGAAAGAGRTERRVVTALNAAKTAILSRFGRSGRPGVSGLYLRLYYMAQDFHERASSSHYPMRADGGVLPQRRAVPLPAPA
jgi:uncharacterized membrane protein YccC